jgi:hypothetical protein
MLEVRIFLKMAINNRSKKKVSEKAIHKKKK